MVIHTEFDLLFVNCAGEAAAQRRICALPAYCLCENVKRVDTVRAAVGRAGSFTDDPEEQRSFLFLPFKFEPSESGLYYGTNCYVHVPVCRLQLPQGHAYTQCYHGANPCHIISTTT